MATPPATEPDPLAYFAVADGVTDPGRHRPLLDALPADVEQLVSVVQGLMVHVFWAERYGLELTEDRKQEVNLRTVARILDRVNELDDRPLDVARPPDRRVVGNCRDHTVLLCAMLRVRGVPARARCGFGAYFLPDHFEDHWVCEYWNADQQRWVLVDAQLDGLQQGALAITFDTLDVPRDQFVVGGLAWQRCRSGDADPDSFGIFDMKGIEFVLGDLVRDVLALNAVELLPWDPWGLMAPFGSPVPDEDLPLLDRLAQLSVAVGEPGGDEEWRRLRELYLADPRLNTPPDRRA